MIRRGFWLIVGAAGGIMGYRRVAALGRQLSGTLGAGQPRANNPRKVTRGLARETIRFTRDVREGMNLYIARHPASTTPTLGASSIDNNVKKDDHNAVG